MLNLYRSNDLSAVLKSLTFRLSVRLSHSFTCTPTVADRTHHRHIKNIQQLTALPKRHIYSSVNSLKKYEMYPAIEPFNVGHLEVSSVHKIYYEQCGNKNGLPIIFVHG